MPVKEDRKRITLEMPASARNKMDELMSITNAVSIAEVIRRAIVLYDMITSHQRKGGSLVFRYEDRVEEVVKVL